jgi:sugar phosphate isomerase/epimerase
MAVDFAAVLQKLHSMGFSAIELCSFPGCAGNPWGDFGELADWQPEQVRAAVDDAGFECIASHFALKELVPEQIDASIRWAKQAGSPAIVLAGLQPGPNADLPVWREAFRSLNTIGQRVRDAGLQFAYHTQNDVWRELDGTLIAAELFQVVDPKLCLIELDPSGALVYGTDWTMTVRQNRGAFFAMHLRDGKRPLEHVPYLPAMSVGAGEEAWDTALDAAFAAGISQYILEMEIEPGEDVFAALQSSIDFLNELTAASDAAVISRAGR